MRQGISLKFILYQFLFALKEGQDTKDFVQNFPSRDAAITANGAPQLIPGVVLVGLIHDVVINIADDSGIVALLILFSRNRILISYGKNIEDCDIKHYLYAIDKSKVVASWIEKYKGADFSNGISLDMLVIIMQEIIDNKKNGDKITNDYYGYNNKYRSLMTALKKPGEADAVVLQAWIKKLENRTAINYGACDLIQKKREIETTIYEIKSIIYSYRNLDDLEFVNSAICHFVARTITSRDLAMNIGCRFAEKVIQNLNGELKSNMKFHMWPEGINVLDMFREFLVDRRNIEDCVAEEVARQINEFYEDDGFVGRGMRVYFEVYVSEKYCKDFLLIYFVDKSTNTLTYKQFYEVCSDADAERMKSLGLEQFVKTE